MAESPLDGNNYTALTSKCTIHKLNLGFVCDVCANDSQITAAVRFIELQRFTLLALE